jgi:hypothetical protein
LPLLFALTGQSETSIPAWLQLLQPGHRSREARIHPHVTHQGESRPTATLATLQVGIGPRIFGVLQECDVGFELGECVEIVRHLDSLGTIPRCFRLLGGGE